MSSSVVKVSQSKPFVLQVALPLKMLPWLTSVFIEMDIGRWSELPTPSTVLQLYLSAHVEPQILRSGVLAPPELRRLGGVSGVDLTTVLVVASSFKMVRSLVVIQSRTISPLLSGG